MTGVDINELKAILDRHAGKVHSDDGPVMTALREILDRHAEMLAEPSESDGLRCPAHGAHPHNGPGVVNGGAVCLDCPICRPPAEPQSESDLLTLVRQYGGQKYMQGLPPLPETRDHGQRAEALFARIEAKVQRLKASADQWAMIAINTAKRASAAPQQDGPIVLTLPEVPEGAVSVVGVEAPHRRYEPFGDLPFEESPAWRRADDGALFAGLGGVLDAEPRGVTVELAPPREPRTWPKLAHDLTGAELPDVVDVETNAGPARWVCVTDDGLYTGPFGGRKTLVELRTLGTVTEVLDPVKLSPPIPWRDVPAGAVVMLDVPRTVLANVEDLGPLRIVMVEGVVPQYIQGGATVQLVALDDTDAVANLGAADLNPEPIERTTP